MIKRVIIDVDDTLIPWKKEYNIEIKNALDELNIKYDNIDLTNISKALDEYENEHYIYNKELMAQYINNYTNKTYPREFLENILRRWSQCVPESISQEEINTLEYLKSKYELVILTDWYAEEQKERLKKLDILKYFSEVYSAEQVNRKPFKEAFLRAIGENKPEECIMVGDNLERDIKGALNAGINAIYYTNKFDDNTIDKKYYCISKLDELIKIL